MKRFWRLGLLVQLSLVVLISAGAYIGVLPTSLPALPHIDLVGHFVLLGLLGFFLDGALGHRPIHRAVPLLGLAPVLVLAVAGIEEIAQRLSPRRSSSVSDFAADVAGVITLCWLSRRVDAAFAARAASAAAPQSAG